MMEYYIVIGELLIVIYILHKHKIDSVFQFNKMKLQRFIEAISTEQYNRYDLTMPILLT